MSVGERKADEIQGIPRTEIPRIEIPRIEIPRIEIPRIEIPTIEMLKWLVTSKERRHTGQDSQEVDMQERQDRYLAVYDHHRYLFIIKSVNKY